MCFHLVKSFETFCELMGWYDSFLMIEQCAVIGKSRKVCNLSLGFNPYLNFVCTGCWIAEVLRVGWWCCPTSSVILLSASMVLLIALNICPMVICVFCKCICPQLLVILSLSKLWSSWYTRVWGSHVHAFVYPGYWMDAKVRVLDVSLWRVFALIMNINEVFDKLE